MSIVGSSSLKLDMIQGCVQRPSTNDIFLKTLLHLHKFMSLERTILVQKGEKEVHSFLHLHSNKHGSIHIFTSIKY